MTQPFDCSIDLTIHMVPPAISPDRAIRQVREAVEELPGAGWISVEWCGDAPPDLPWLRRYRPGKAGAPTGDEWDALAADVRGTVHRALVVAAAR